MEADQSHAALSRTAKVMVTKSVFVNTQNNILSMTILVLPMAWLKTPKSEIENTVQTVALTKMSWIQLTKIANSTKGKMTSVLFLS